MNPNEAIDLRWMLQEAEIIIHRLVGMTDLKFDSELDRRIKEFMKLNEKVC